jgi:hypothetical protein
MDTNSSVLLSIDIGGHAKPCLFSAVTIPQFEETLPQSKLQFRNRDLRSTVLHFCCGFKDGAGLLVHCSPVFPALWIRICSVLASAPVSP